MPKKGESRFNHNFDKDYYLYHHIRPDTNIVFYVSVGRKKKKWNPYHRAYSRNGRTKEWKEVVDLNDNKFIVIIVFECKTHQEVCREEIDQIKQIGRIDLGTGLLVNLVNGGNGGLGYVYSKELKEKMSLMRKDKPPSKNTIDASIKRTSKPIIQLDNCGKFIKEWNSTVEASRALGIKRTSIKEVLRGKLRFANEYIFIKKVEYDKNKDYARTTSYKNIFQYSLSNILIQKHKSIAEAAKYIETSETNMSRIARGKKKTNLYKGFYWYTEKQII